MGTNLRGSFEITGGRLGFFVTMDVSIIGLVFRDEKTSIREFYIDLSSEEN